MSLVLIWWFVSAHKWFKGMLHSSISLKCALLMILGPVINVEHHMLGREEGVVDGVETSDSDTPVPYNKKAELEGETLPTTEIN